MKMMKKLIALFAVLALMLPAAALADRMAVHITCCSYDAAAIGSNWAGEYQLGEYQLFDGDVFDIPLGDLEVFTRITDWDSSPEYGEVYTVYNVTRNRLNKGFTVEQEVQVVENGGRYKGYYATWYIYYDFTPVADCIVIH